MKIEGEEGTVQVAGGSHILEGLDNRSRNPKGTMKEDQEINIKILKAKAEEIQHAQGK